MLKRFLVSITLMLALLAFVVPMSAVAQEGACDDYAYREGFHAYGFDGHRYGGRTVEIRAEKVREGNWAQSQLYIRFDETIMVRDWYLETTVVIPGDPDNLEVSCDLGWAGLDTVVEGLLTHTLNDEIVSQEYVLIEIHLDLYHAGRYRDIRSEGDYFVRDARIYGTVEILGQPDRTFTFLGGVDPHAGEYPPFSSLPVYEDWAVNRSTQYGGW